MICWVVINRKTTKFESNSQLRTNDELAIVGCYQSQNYKIWKQFTTIMRMAQSNSELLSITKLQNLKAIHNVLKPDSWPLTPKSCYQSQNYEIWKQFTTSFRISCSKSALLSITKLRNLKAIHNLGIRALKSQSVVINHKTTKFESNSQQFGKAFVNIRCCYQSQNYEIWKQFTTTSKHLFD